MDNSITESSGTFAYFGYGSNLLSKRIKIQNPTAKRRAIGKLKNYKLDFKTQSQSWNGCSADIVEDDGSEVWGAIWDIDMCNMADLDKQEGVELNLYKALWRSVETPNGEEINCRVYQQVPGSDETYPLEDLPFDRRPSRSYLTVILNGAEESQLPAEYVDKLRKIPHNDRVANKPELKALCE